MMRENPSSKIRNRKFKIVWFSFVALIVAVYFWGLTLPLFGPDEPRYSQVAREMLERGDWITPRLGGFDWFEKPALLYWLQIASYHLFGVNEFAARFGSALFGLGTILALWILGRQWSALSVERSAENPLPDDKKDSAVSVRWSAFADWLALIAASSIGLIAFAHAASFDIILTFPVTASLVGFFIADQAEEKSGFAFYSSLFTFYFFAGLALLAKGLVGAVFPAGIVGFYYLLSRKLPDKKIFSSFLWGAILSLLVAGVWYLPMYQINGWKFVDEFFIQHHFQRYTSNKYLHPQPVYFFFWVLPLMTLPWLPFFLAAIFDSVKKAFRRKTFARRTPHSALRIFACAWLVVPLVFFSLSGSKLPGYILPALPGALILTTDYVYRFVRQSEKRKKALLAVALASFAGVVIVVQFFAADYARAETVKTLIQTADRAGFAGAKILNMHTFSHNAEFYAAGRLVRAADGKLKSVDGTGAVIDELEIAGGEDRLVLIPLEYVSQLTENERLAAKVLGDNGELAVVAVKLK